LFYRIKKTRDKAVGKSRGLDRKLRYKLLCTGRRNKTGLCLLRREDRITGLGFPHLVVAENADQLELRGHVLCGSHEQRLRHPGDRRDVCLRILGGGVRRVFETPTHTVANKADETVWVEDNHYPPNRHTRAHKHMRTHLCTQSTHTRNRRQTGKQHRGPHSRLLAPSP